MQGGQIKHPLTPLQIAVAQALLIYKRYKNQEGTFNVEEFNKEINNLNTKDEALKKDIESKKQILGAISANKNKYSSKAEKAEIEKILNMTISDSTFEALINSVADYTKQLEEEKAREEKRLAEEEERLAEKKRIEEAERQAKEERIAREAAKKKRIEDEQKRLEAERIAKEEKHQAELKRLAEEKEKRLEAERIAKEEKLQAEEQKRLEAEAARQAAAAEAKLNKETIQVVLEKNFPYLYEGIKAVKKLNKLDDQNLQEETLDFFYKDEGIIDTDQISLKGAITGIKNSPLLKKEFSGPFKSEVKEMLSNLNVYNTQELKNLFNKLILSMNGLAGAFVKIWDSPKTEKTETQDEVLYDNDIKDATINVNYEEKKITIPNNSICELDSQTYGPFKGVFDRKNENPMTNTHVFDFIKDEYKMFEQIGFDKKEGEEKVNPRNFRLFAFGYSGSGKTYTLIQGTKDDPSVLAKTLEYLYTNKDASLSILLSIQIYYPLTNKTIIVKNTEITNKISALGQTSFGNFGTDVNDLINSVEDYMIENLYTVPTTNNPNSSRAFTLYTIKIGADMGKIYFTDMPGNEKTSLIKNDFLFTDEFIKNLKALNEQKNKLEPTNFKGQVLKSDSTKSEEMSKIYKFYDEKKTPKLNNKQLLKNSKFIQFLSDINTTETTELTGTNTYFSYFIRDYLTKNVLTKAHYKGNVYGEMAIYDFLNPFFIDVMELINQKIKGEIVSEAKAEMANTYILPSIKMINDFVNAFKNKILNLLKTTKKSSASMTDKNYKSYDLRKGQAADKNILINVFNKVFNPCFNKETRNVDYSISEGPRLFTKKKYIEGIIESFNKRNPKDLKLRISSEINKIEYKNVLSPIIYLYILIIDVLETDAPLRTQFKVDSPDRENLFKFYFTYRVIDFITTQGDYINTALENHKFVFLKRSNFFNSTKCANESSEDGNTTILDIIPSYELVHNQSLSDPCTDIVGDTGKIKFKKQDYKINVTIGSGKNKLVLTEKIRREYLPVMNELLYGENETTGKKMKEKFITLIAIKRLEVEGNEAKQKARCDYAQESLDFADQISGNSKSFSGGNYLKYNKKRKSMKKNKRSNKRKQSKKRKIIRI